MRPIPYSLFALLLLSTAIYGGTSVGTDCSRFFERLSTKSQHTVRFVGAEASEIGNRQRQLYLESLRKVDARVLDESKLLEAPAKNIEISQKRRSRSPVAKNREDRVIIETPVQYHTTLAPYRSSTERRVYTKHPKFTAPALMHEYGHMIFRHNLAKLDPDYRLLFSLEDEFLGVTEQALTAKNTLAQAIESAADKEQLQRLSGRVEQLKDSFYSLRSRLDELKKQRDPRVLGMFDEFFADFVAVVTTKDPKAISKIAFFPNERRVFKKSDKLGSANYDWSTFRDFSHKNNEIGVWPGSELELEDIHEALAPSRYFLFDQYLRYPKYLGGPDRARLIDRVFEAMVETLKKFDHADKEFTLNKINESFISSIRTRMGQK